MATCARPWDRRAAVLPGTVKLQRAQEALDAREEFMYARRNRSSQVRDWEGGRRRKQVTLSRKGGVQCQDSVSKLMLPPWR